MEDVSVCMLDTRQDKAHPVRVSFFAVFDGHGGYECAKHAAQHLHTAVMAAGFLPNEVVRGDQKPDIKAMKSAIVEVGAWQCISGDVV
eukprot:jgi/Chrzof1/5623/Cz16g09100.t1